jgi:hypothetical protein
VGRQQLPHVMQHAAAVAIAAAALQTAEDTKTSLYCEQQPLLPTAAAVLQPQWLATQTALRATHKSSHRHTNTPTCCVHADSLPREVCDACELAMRQLVSKEAPVLSQVPAGRCTTCLGKTAHCSSGY